MADAAAPTADVAPTSVKAYHIDMPDEYRDFAYNSAIDALQQYEKGELQFYKDCAKQIKKSLDERFQGAWHVVVGKSFGNFFTAEVKRTAYFFIGPVGFLVWQHG
jgi:dynein light chain LC8-type